MGEKIEKTEEQWKQQLTPEQYHITREKGTEPPNSGEYCHYQAPGVYACVCCGQELFSSQAKFDSGSGWPSYLQPIAEDHVRTESDESQGMRRTEVLCGCCDAHLGHVFDDGPDPTGLRYCINSRAIRHVPSV